MEQSKALLNDRQTEGSVTVLYDKEEKILGYKPLNYPTLLKV